jgi:hypothetical protein
VCQISAVLSYPTKQAEEKKWVGHDSFINNKRYADNIKHNFSFLISPLVSSFSHFYFLFVLYFILSVILFFSLLRPSFLFAFFLSV